mgnify:CR=1 FL=1
MSNDFLSIMSAHAADVALVHAEGNARGKVIARAKACKGEKAIAELEVWLWGARMVQYVAANVKGATAKSALGMVAAEKAKAAKARATWYDKAASAARNYAFHIRKEAGLVATDKRGGKRDNAGRKVEADTVAPVAAKVETAKPVAAKVEKPSIDKAYHPGSAREAAMFARENLAALLSIVKPQSSAAFVKALTAALAAAQAEIANCE